MLKEIKKKNEQSIVDFYEKAFGENYAISAEWGVPNIRITLSSKDGKNHWRFSVNTETEEFFIESKGDDDAETQEWSGIDGKTLSFVVGNIINLNNKFFGLDNAEAPAEKEEK